jgi:mannose-6-phosphate isomerase-like protein (cupin superfamily)
MSFASDKFHILAVVKGRVTVSDGKEQVELESGGFCLIPAFHLKCTKASFEAGSTLLTVVPGQ